MAYAIMRAKKLANMGSVAASMQHCYRERETHNADQERTPDNQHLGAKSTDEATPHLSAFVVPLTKDKRLSAKEFIGSRDKMRADQTSYAGCVADLGLERGIEGSKATHQTIQQHYAAVQRGVTPKATLSPKSLEPRVLEKAGFMAKTVLGRGDLVESPEMIAERLTKAVNAGFAGVIATASTAFQERRRAKEMQDTANDLRKRLEVLQGAFKGLTKDQVKQVLKVAMTFQHENVKAKEESKAIRREQGKTVQDRGRSPER